ncbi:MAG TPA: hypothetical protein VHW67_05070 [Solirubrobacteraceae bacterium]|jgi:hypothetical protein|nr:hypothetical protein [Solirubrobacteraceae bacterium]
MRAMQNSNIRTIAIRFSLTEHRLLGDLAAAHGVDLETLIREALTFGPVEAKAAAPRLRVVQGDPAPGAGWDQGRVLPSR